MQIPLDLTGVMMVQITDASLNETSLTANFLSVMSVNVSALMNAGVTEVVVECCPPLEVLRSPSSGPPPSPLSMLWRGIVCQ